ncbi:Sexual differentiation process protein isp4, partial [Neolecta irregularis DAH-3]
MADRKPFENIDGKQDAVEFLCDFERSPSDVQRIENIERDLEMTDADLKEPHVLETAAAIDIDEARALLKKTLDQHRFDIYFPNHLLRNIEKALQDTEKSEFSDKGFDDIRKLVDEIKLEAATLLENSPYPEVRAVVDNTDDPSLPINTFRAWFIGLFFTIIGNGVNQLFSIRLPSIYIDTVVIQLIAFPCGKFFEKVLPTRKFKTFGYEWSLNPGPFNHKEHILITIMANVSFSPGGIYVTSIFINQRLPMFLNQQWASDRGYQFLLALSTQLMGYGLAGMTR